MSKRTEDIRKKRISREQSGLHITGSMMLFLMLAAILCGCGRAGGEASGEGQPGSGAEAGVQETDPEEQPGTGIAYETAADAAIDFAALQAENPDIFAWLYVPGTDIDAPVLQSVEADDYYENHNAYGEKDEGGALYTELANLKDMCDFNTVVHGRTPEDGSGGLFADLYQFADPDFFSRHEDVYVYLDGNLLTYTVFAAYERENTSLIRDYDFTYGQGCAQFLEDLYGEKQMGKNLREGWEDVTPYHFLITLTARQGRDAGKQFVVVAALVGDAAGTVDRTVEW